jgi:hypothetical protein
MKKIDPNLPPGRDSIEQAQDRRVIKDAIARGEAERKAAGSNPGADDPAQE